MGFSGNIVVGWTAFSLLVACIFHDAFATKAKVAGVKQNPAPMKLCSRAIKAYYPYVGNKRCKMCHRPWFQSWQTLPHSRATSALDAGVSRAYKMRLGLDPDRDYLTNAKCLCCHTVGYGMPGGYRIPETHNRRSKRFARQREGVGCESCHGPGNGYTVVMSEIEDSIRTYKIEELRSKGLVKITASVCTSCHRPAAPCIEQTYTFDSRRLGGKSFHASFKLTHRGRQ